jgi:hypothetical protein
VNPPRNRKGEAGNPPPNANASELYPNPVVLMRPGNVGGGKGPQLKGNARSDEDGGIDHESINPSKRSEIADGVAR